MSDLQRRSFSELRGPSRSRECSTSPHYCRSPSLQCAMPRSASDREGVWYVDSREVLIIVASQARHPSHNGRLPSRLYTRLESYGHRVDLPSAFAERSHGPGELADGVELRLVNHLEVEVTIPTLARPYELVSSRSSALFMVYTRLMGNSVHQRCSHTAAVRRAPACCGEGQKRHAAFEHAAEARCRHAFEAAAGHGCLARGTRCLA